MRVGLHRLKQIKTAFVGNTVPVAHYGEAKKLGKL